jgi:hypothetical protein
MTRQIESRLPEDMNKATKTIALHVTLKPAIVDLNNLIGLLVKMLLEQFLSFG